MQRYHKLLKSDVEEVEHGQQCSGAALTKRLLVAIMVCVLSWALTRIAQLISELAPLPQGDKSLS
jgi:hypothetical protein